MQTGKLEHQVSIYSVAETNVGGEITRAPTLLDTVWAHILTERGSEALESARTNARSVIRVQIRYRDDVTTEHQLTWEGQTYSILSLDRSDRRKGFLWMSAQVVGAL